MTAADPILGAALGAIAAGLLLRATWHRAQLVARRGSAFPTLATLPISILAPAVCLAIAAGSTSSAATSLLTFWVVRSLYLLRTGSA